MLDRINFLASNIKLQKASPMYAFKICIQSTVSPTVVDYSNSPKLSSSPQPNSEFLREPPDGAEKVKIIDEV